MLYHVPRCRWNDGLQHWSDGGALATTTDRCEYLWSYHAFTEDKLLMVPSLQVADDSAYKPTGVGYLAVPASGGDYTHHFVRSYYTPEIPATIISPETTPIQRVDDLNPGERWVWKMAVATDGSWQCDPSDECW